MRLTIGPSLLATALLAGAAFALFPRAGGPAGATREASIAPTRSEKPPAGAEAFNTTSPGSAALPPNHPSIDSRAAALPQDTTLPPNHPAIGSRGDGHFAGPEDAAALAWIPPSGWNSIPNRSTMRLATYRVPGAATGDAPAELTVTRAGGSTEENLQRWVGQFDGSGKDTRAVRMVAGFRVTTLDVSGTYDGGMSSTGPEDAHHGWSMLAAVVETTGPSYFFKMVGPSDAVRAARPAFEQLIGGIRKPG